MREFWNRFTTSRYWFLGTLVVVGILILIIWRALDYKGYVTTVNGWMHDLKEIMEFILIMAMVFAAIGMMFGWRLFRRRRGGGGGH